VYAVGVNGTTLRWDGNTWTVLSTALGWELWDVWASAPDDAWALGQTWTMWSL
jgi:hypothetical protein